MGTVGLSKLPGQIWANLYKDSFKLKFNRKRECKTSIKILSARAEKKFKEFC